MADSRAERSTSTGFPGAGEHGTPAACEGGNPPGIPIRTIPENFNQLWKWIFQQTEFAVKCLVPVKIVEIIDFWIKEGPGENTWTSKSTLLLQRIGLN